MMDDLLLAGLGMGANYLGQRQGANAVQNQIDSEMRQEQALQAQRNAGIGNLAMQLGPQNTLRRALAERGRTLPGQQDQVAAVRKAYGINPQVDQATSALGPSVGDAAWQRAFGIVGAQNQSAVGQEALNERSLDARQWWLQRFAPNRIARAGDQGRFLRNGGQILTAYGLGNVNQKMAQPAATTPSAAPAFNAAGGVGTDPYGPQNPDVDPFAPGSAYNPGAR